MAASNYLLFKINAETYGVDITRTGTIEKNLPITPVPNAPSPICGMINLRNEAIPVVSIKKKFSLKEDDSAYELIIGEAYGKPVAYKVDSVSTIAVLDLSSVNDIPAMLKNGEPSISKIVNYEGQLVIILDLEKMIEKEAVEKVHENIGNQE